MNAHEAYVALNMMEGIGPVSVKALVEALGSPEAIWQADRSTLMKAPGIGPGLADKILSQRNQIDPGNEIRRAAEMGAALITPADPGYPPALAQIHDPPLALYVRGEFQPKDRHALAIVGTRHPSHYGKETAARLSAQLARSGWTVVSGLARGIDTAAHSAALTASGRTIAVLGGGLAHIYPPENRPLAERIAAGHGAVITEFPLDRAPDRTTFPMRNRIISGLARGVLVVEASRQSGALITANQALEQGRSVMAVPGRIDAPGARGTHALIKNGARLVEDLEDILAEFEFLLPQCPQPGASKPDEPVGTPVNLTDEELRIMAVLQDEEQDFDVLIRQTGISAARLNVVLLTMEMKRLVKVLPGRLVAATRSHA
ncbi:MAG: DNA-processing protein DprA [Kiritimatiellia bacterium]